ncbi:contact-dependent growth inhibition system immunity protein [Pseudomonas sp. dw_358]|uniref:contact-dependent growth inhibition system immunity protein n=1 Tax=Pseudomonas sp. dw_358 TaxID=2720083 RepID=UPI001BD3B14B|nr:contact-dependent growth inhibition system immunity protein [Pseudomonas sp. dw_358]
MTFRELEVAQGSNWQPEANPSSLTQWYSTVRDVPLCALDVGDVCRALRQELYVLEVLPRAVSLLTDDALAGDRYDGELIAALATLQAKYWRDNAELARKAAYALSEIDDGIIDTDLKSDIFKFTQALSA